MPNRRIEVQNVIRPGSRRMVDAEMYEGMRRAYLAVVPAAPPGLTLGEIRTRVLRKLPQRLYPSGAKAGWWAKTVQLDLEAKGVVKRTKTTPLRLYRARS